jgi:hypothetical protein
MNPKERRDLSYVLKKYMTEHLADKVLEEFESFDESTKPEPKPPIWFEYALYLIVALLFMTMVFHQSGVF